MTENELARVVFNKGLMIHRELGPGLLESVYEECLYYELNSAGLKVSRQKPISIRYAEIELKDKFIADLIVENKVLIELKSISKLGEIHFAQTLTYLRLTELKLGLLINFNVPLFKNGVRRVINGDLK